MTTGNLFKPEFSEKQLVAECFELDEWMTRQACPWISPDWKRSYLTEEFGMAGVLIHRALEQDAPLAYLGAEAKKLREIADFIEHAAERAQMYARGARVSMRQLERQLQESTAQ
jgi:hypothetical protein